MWYTLQIFGFRALWSPYFLLLLVLIGLLYYIVTGPERERFGLAKGPTPGQYFNFYTGLGLLYLVKGSPIDLLSHILFSAHMVQMVVLYFVLPILFIRGIPKELLEGFLSLPVIRPLFAFFTRPIIALSLFNSMFALYHIPAIFDFSKSSKLIHLATMTGLFLLAVFMWWPIVTPLKQERRMVPLIKMGYLVVSMFIISIACALIIFADEPLFEVYYSGGAWVQALSLCVPTNVMTGLSGSLTSAEMFSPLTSREDQQLGGILMMMLQQVIYGYVIARIFFAWFSKKNMQIDPLPKKRDMYYE